MPTANERFVFGCGLLLLTSCQRGATAERASSSSSASAALVAKADYTRLPRQEFNRRAVTANLPVFWRRDENSDGTLQPNELVVTWRHEAHTESEFVDAHSNFTPAFAALYEQLQKSSDDSALRPEERKRRASVRLELLQGRPTLVESDFSKDPESDKKLVRHVLRIALSIERLYAKQKGSAGLESKLVPGDTASAALFFRNQGPECAAAKTERDPDCHALPEAVKPVFGLYPAEIQSDHKFCELLSKQKNKQELLDHFSVVLNGDTPGTFKASKYSQAYAPEMTEVASELDAAAADLGADQASLKAYLQADAQAFRTNDWEPANRAWVDMGTDNSKYYLRVGPDEVYYEPCAWKAGFALAFARINPDSVTWRKRLEPIKQTMEDDLAKLAGKPYTPRSVRFKLPDFIDIALNAGDNRAPIGGTVGQSLPNWGPVAEKGGRTVTMTNIYTDEDSHQSLREQMSSLYCKATMQKTDPSRPPVMGVVLHEAAHNLGPAHDYKVKGQVDTAIFGGPLASTLEELKAQSAALYFTSMLVDRQLISQADADVEHLQEVAWTFGHIAQGMYNAQGKPKNYSQLAAIQLGSLQAAGAVEWKPSELAENGTDPGCIEVHLDRWNQAATKLMRQAIQIKARGDKAAAEGLLKRWVDGEGDFKVLRGVIASRWLRSARGSLVYALGGL